MNFLDAIDPNASGFGTFYDELPLWSAPFGLLMLQHLPLRRGMTILDVGAGTGFLSLELAQRCGPDSRVVAVDPWSTGVHRLREKLRHLELANVEVIEADAGEVDLPDACFDLIVSNLGVNNFENADAVLARCFAMAKPGATLAITSNTVGHMQEFYDVFRATLEELELAQCLPALEAHVAHRGTLESLVRLVSRAGFERVQCVTDSFAIRFADGHALLRHYFIRLGFLPDWKRLVPDGEVARVFTLLEERLDGVARERGSLDLRIPMVYLESARPG